MTTGPVESGQAVFTLLDKLIEQTKFGNVQWVPGPEPYSWRFRGTEAAVILASVDKDGDLPVRLTIINKAGRRTNSWEVGFQSSPEEEAFDVRVRELFRMVLSQGDPVGSLIRDLDNMPPF